MGGGELSGASALMVVTGLFQGYMTLNMARKALVVAGPGLSKELGLSKTELGLVSSSFTAMYGVSKFLGSVATDHFSCRLLFTTGLLLTGLLCVAFSMSSSLARFCLLWSVHGVVQGVGWPALAKICLDRVPLARQGLAWAALTASGSLGHMIAAPVLVRVGGGWRGMMRAVGVASLTAGGGAWAMTGTRKILHPPTKDAPAKMEEVVEVVEEDTKELPVPEGPPEEPELIGSGPIWLQRLRGSPLVREYWWLAGRLLKLDLAPILVADLLTYFVIKGLGDWSVLLLTETKGLTQSEAVSVFFYCEFGAIVGNLASGFVSDQVGFLRSTTSSAFTFLTLPCLWATHAARLGNAPFRLAALAVAYFFLGVFINGPKTLTGIIVRKAVPPNLAGTAAGVQAYLGQCGASWAGVPVGYIAQNLGWPAVWALWGFAVLSSAFLLAIPGVFLARRTDVHHKLE